MSVKEQEIQIADYQSIQATREDNIFVIKLHRPDKFNALNEHLRHELVHALNTVRYDESVRAIVIWGGEQVFAAGADLAEMVDRTPMQALRRISQNPDVSEAMATMLQPTIAAISGLALGGGLELALATDLRIASSTAQFGQPEINVGLIPGGGATQRLSRLIGVAKAKEMILLGDRIDAYEAFRLGLANKVVAAEDLLDEAKSWAKRLAAKPMNAMRMAKYVIDKGLDAELQQGLTMEGLAFAVAFSTADQKEGARAFVEKRAAVFAGEPK